MSLNQRISPSLSENIRLQQAPVRKQAGFTLIELLTVIGILGIFMTIAVPAFQEWREHSAVNAATMAVFAKLKQARTIAVSDRRPVVVVFDTVNNDIVYDDNNGVVCTPCNNATLDLDQFSSQVVLTSNQGNTTFNSNGSADSFGTIKLSIGSFYKCISINRIGRAFIEQANPTCAD